jgi:fumarate hydratase subunit beta
MFKLNTPLDKKTISKLKAGDKVLLSGVIYTARDQAHKRLLGLKKPPVSLKGEIIYYCGPTPAKQGRVIGACGPTTSSRMDNFTPSFLKKGVVAMIGKGKRSKEVKDAVKKYKAVYFVTIAGAGAYLSEKIEEAEVVAFRKLGAEAIYRLKVKDFPLYVAIDSKGRSIY